MAGKKKIDDITKAKQGAQTLLIFAFFFWITAIGGFVQMGGFMGDMWLGAGIFGLIFGLIFTIWGIKAYQKANLMEKPPQQI